MNKNKKILQVCNSDFYLTRFLQPLVIALVERGYEVHVATEGKNIPLELLQKLIIHQIEFPKSTSPVSFYKCIRSLRAIIRKEKFFCVNGHNRNASIVSRLAGWLEGIPINLYTAHGFYYHDGQGTFARSLTIGLEAILALITHFTLSQSARDTKLMTSLNLIKPKNIETIGNGIDIRKFTSSETRESIESRLELNRGVFRIVSVGRIVRGKGFMDLVEAFHLLTSRSLGGRIIELIIVGGNIEADIDSELDRVKKFLTVKGMNNKVIVTGIVSNVQDYMAVSDIFVSASYREGMPRVLLEAMCIGLPVVATDIRGSAEIVRDGINGYLYPAGNVAELHAKLESLFFDSVKREVMGRENRQLVMREYSEAEYTLRQIRSIDKLFSISS